MSQAEEWREFKSSSLYALLVGVALAVYGAWGLWHFKVESNWKPVEATILRASAQADLSFATLFEKFTSNTRTTREYCTVGFHYEFEVDGRKFSGDDSGGRRMLREQAELEAKGHTLGEKLRVYCDPADPSRSTLSKRSAVTGVLAFVIGVGLLVGVYLSL